MEAERRQVTVLFTDMVGFTSFSEKAGEEAAFTLMQSLSRLLDEAVREQGGVVQGFTGDGIMAVFGAPVAFEDAPLRACRAALSIFDRLASAGGDDLEARHRIRPQLRIGINAGLAVVGQVQGGEGAGVTVLGDNVNVAARLQSEAEPGTAVMSEAMHRLVQGFVAASFIGERKLKGKAEQQKVYRLDAILRGATRFEAAIGRGLSAYVGRESEMDALVRALAKARSQIEIVEVMAEPGMGKSRLLHEFRQRIDERASLVLSGSCSPDGRQTALLPFIDVVRGAFRLGIGEGEAEIARKLADGLTALNLYSPENLALLQNLLGLKPQEDALVKLDGLLVGLRTRELLYRLLQARCRLSQVVLLIEDLHWVDSVSEEVLGAIVMGNLSLPLLLLYTRRPEYFPSWRGLQSSINLHLEPLTASQVKELVQGRLGVESLPETFAQLIADRAEGNALFAEEIISFMSERGALRVAAGKVEFDPTIALAALPASVQSLLTARVDQLPFGDRALLQAAAVIGRRFDSRLLAAVIGAGDDTDAKIAAIQALDLVYPAESFGEYLFKHALVRDALYQSLLTEPRVVLHAKVANEIERRSDNRLPEVAETLAYHYSQTALSDKIFTYMAMAGKKCLGVYSLEDAGNYFADAIALLDKSPACAADEQTLDMLSDYALFCNLSYRIIQLNQTVDHFRTRLDRRSDDPRYIFILHHHVIALLYSGKYQEAQKAQAYLKVVADRLDDVRCIAYALVCDVQVSTIVAPHPLAHFENIVRELEECLSKVDDPYLQHFARFAIGWEEIYRGRLHKTQEAATALALIGNKINDPRSIGFSMMLQCWRELVRDNYDAALDLANKAINIAKTPFDHANARNAKSVAVVLVRNANALSEFESWMDECRGNGWLYPLEGTEAFYSVALVLNGQITKGVKYIEEAIVRRDQVSNRTVADWFRMYLCDVIIEIISGNERPPVFIIAKNILTIVRLIFKGEDLINKMVHRIRCNTQFDIYGQHIGRCEAILGFLYKAKGKHELSVRHLLEAKRITSQFGRSPLLLKIEAALVDVG